MKNPKTPKTPKTPTTPTTPTTAKTPTIPTIPKELQMKYNCNNSDLTESCAGAGVGRQNTSEVMNSKGNSKEKSQIW